MQMKNNYRMEYRILGYKDMVIEEGTGVFNGDIGMISDINTIDKELTVQFENRFVKYDITDLDELVHAYAITIHKSQGSEYPIVVMPVMMTHFIMLQRNLIYTGITRAKKMLVLVGTKKALSYAVRHVTVHKRNTRLKQRLTEMTERPKQAAAPVKAEPQQNPETAWHRKDLFERIAASKFRSSFKLKDADIAYIKDKGMDTIRSHAKDIIAKRLAPSVIPNDGKQTPMRGAPHGHPVFLAQHATGTCCRGCLEKWHRIPKGRKLSESEQERIVNVIMEWIARQMK
jgi:exodeoxyribonuclease V alpha subunit